MIFTAVVTVCLHAMPCDPGSAAAVLNLTVTAETEKECETAIREAMIISDPATVTYACFLPKDSL